MVALSLALLSGICENARAAQEKTRLTLTLAKCAEVDQKTPVLFEGRVVGTVDRLPGIKDGKKNELSVEINPKEGSLLDKCLVAVLSSWRIKNSKKSHTVIELLSSTKCEEHKAKEGEGREGITKSIRGFSSYAEFWKEHR